MSSRLASVTLASYSSGGHRVAVRTCGGPAGDDDVPRVVLLHQSPLSSRRFAAALPYLSEWCVPYALDTPDYGLSSPSPHQWTVGEYAEVLGDFVAGLSGRHVWVFGRATGAVLAYEIARAAAARLAGCILYGLPVYTEDERLHRLEDFAPPYRPDRTGEHVTSLWHRIYDQYPAIDPMLATSILVDYLLAGPDYARAYRAIWNHQLAALPPHAQERCWILGGGRDRLSYMFDRAKELLPHARSYFMNAASDFVADEHPEEFSRLLRALVTQGAPPDLDADRGL